MCEELRKKGVDVCCLQDVRWKGHRPRFVSTLGRRYKLWWSGNDAGFGAVGILVKEKISGNVVEVKRKSVRVMGIVLTLGGEVMRIICANGPQSGRPDSALKVLVKSSFLWGISMEMWENVLRIL